MRRSSLAVHVVLLIVSIVALTALVQAQYGASLEGTVTDKSGAVIGGATVTITNQATGVSRNSVTGDSGFYRITGLPPGRYKVEVDAPSFKKSTKANVDVGAEAVSAANVTLDTGSASETVTVTAGTEDLQTEGASMGGTITSQQVVDLPEFGRDPYELLRLTPGVFADASRQGNGNSLGIPQQVGPGGSNSQIFQTENQVQAIANGQRVSANNFMLDGVSINSLEWGGAAVITPNEESVQEISVVSTSYSAQDGRNSGAQVKVISKSGVNNLHGSAFVKFNDKGLNAFNKFYGPTNVALTSITCETATPSQFTITASHCPDRADQKYRDYAGSLGGPIIKNRLFFFFSYEGVRLKNTVPVRSVSLETPQFEQYVVAQNPGSIAAKLFSTPGITPRISTTISTTDCCSLIPGYGIGRWYLPGNTPFMNQAVGNGPDGIPDWGIFDLTVPNSSSGNQYNGRVDYTKGNNQFFASTYIVRLNNFNGGQRPIDDLSLLPHNYVGTVGWTRVIGPTMLNEFRVNFTRYDFDQTQPTGQTNFGIPQFQLFDFDIGGFPENKNIIGISQSATTPGALAQNTYGLADTFSWVRNKHALKFGFEGRRQQNNNNEPGAQRPLYQFRGLLNLANDACCFFEQVQVNPTGGALNGQRYFRDSDYGLFAQDDWKVRPNLTVNLGLRWEYFTPLTEAKNVQSNYIFGSQGFINGSVCAPVAPLSRCPNGSQLYQPNRHNFGPRIGFAWSPDRYNSKLVFRGGFGIVFNRNSDVVFDNIRQDTPYSALASACCFFDNGTNVGPPLGSNILYSLGANRQANSYPVNPAFSNGVAPDGALCADSNCGIGHTQQVSLFGALPHEPNPYVYIFSYQAELQPFTDWVFKLGYQGSRSRKLVRTIDLNRIMPGDTFDGTLDQFQSVGSNLQPCGPTNPTCLAAHATGNNRFSNLYFPLPDVNASYDAAVFTASRKFKRGFQVDANYTYSHAIDTASFEVGYQQADPFTPSINRGSSDFDVRNNFVLDALWEIPVFRARHDFLGTALGGWSVSGIMSKHSGFPYSALIGTCNRSADRNGDSYCPDLPFAYNGGVILSPSKQNFINGVFPTCHSDGMGNVTLATCPNFDVATRGPGCRCRNIFTGPGYTSVDMTVGKDFVLPRAGFLGEGSKLAIRANFFNIFNILNLSPFIPAAAPTDIFNNGTPATNAGQFGHAPDGLAGRVIEFQARLSF
jgi:hypothetical protein